MKRIKLFGLALMAVFALGVVIAASASALEAGLLYLAGDKGLVEFSGEGPAGELVGLPSKTNIKCVKTSVLGGVFIGTEKHVKEGTIKEIHFTGCKLEKGESKVACNTEKDEKEVILLPENTPFGQFNKLEASKKLSPGIGVSPKEFTILCAAGVTKVKIKGEALGTVEASLTMEVSEAKLKFAGNLGIVCDTEESEALQKLCKEGTSLAGGLLANFTGAFEEADLLGTVTIKLNHTMLLDD